MSNKSNYREIVLAALLHDIGKFSQRTREKSYATNDETLFCPKSKQGYYTHQHVLFTDGFFRDFEKYFPSEINIRKTRMLAVSHHVPHNAEEYIKAFNNRKIRNRKVFILLRFKLLFVTTEKEAGNGRNSLISCYKMLFHKIYKFFIAGRRDISCGGKYYFQSW